MREILIFAFVSLVVVVAPSKSENSDDAIQRKARANCPVATLGRFCGPSVGKCCQKPWICKKTRAGERSRCRKKTPLALRQVEQEAMDRRAADAAAADSSNTATDVAASLRRFFRRGSRCRRWVTLGRFCSKTVCCRDPMECRVTMHGPRKRCAKQDRSEAADDFWAELAEDFFS